MRDSGRRKVDQAGEVRAMSDEEAGSNRSLARHRLPARARRTMAGEPSEGHDDLLMSSALLTETVASESRAAPVGVCETEGVG
jgi:hypothetical protein